MIKTLFKNYELGRKIGSGGMASLYEARDTRLNRRVAVKILHPALAQDEDYIARFESEAREAASLNHRNVVTIHDYGSEDDVYFIVMEFVEGMDLRVALQKQPRLPQEIALTIIEETACGLDALHRKGLIHRDLKPANILLSREGEVKIGDFGLAKRTNAPNRLALTVPGQVMGTLHYMSPEQVVGKEIDARSDIFSLGVTACEMLTGQRPFDGASYSEVVDKLVSYPSPHLAELEHFATPAMAALISRMMDKDLTRRCQNMGQVLRDLETVVETLPDPNGFSRLRRQYLQRFVADPVGFSAELERASVKRFVERGRYYMSLGLGRFDDAVAEFRAALALDPGNTTAAEALSELTRGRPGDASVTTKVHHVPNPAVDAAPATEAVTIALPGRDASGAAVDRTEAAPAPSSLPPAGAATPARAPRLPRRRMLAGALGIVLILALGLGLRAWLTAAPSPPVPRALPTGAARLPPSSPPAAARAAPVVEPPVAATPVAGPRLRLGTEPAGAAVAYRAPGEARFVETGLLTPCQLDLPRAGRWEVRLARTGYQPVTELLSVDASRELAPRRLVPLLPEGTLNVQGNPAGARVRLLAGPPSAAIPAGRFVAPCAIAGLGEGAWRVRISREGFASRDTVVSITAGVERPLQFQLAPLAPREGHVRVSVFPPGYLYVDGALFRPEPAKLFLVGLSAGTAHTLEIRTSLGESYRWNDVKVAAGDTLRLPHRRLGSE